MDLLTHGIMGATLAQCGFQKSLGRKALLWGAIAAMLPDIDVLVELFAGPLAGFKYHRWITHSLWFGPFMGSALGYVAWRLEHRPQALSQWIFLFILTLTTHPLLDLLTSFGTQLFSPFSDQRCSLDIISVVDLRFTGPLLVALVMGFVFRQDKKNELLDHIKPTQLTQSKSPKNLVLRFFIGAAIGALYSDIKQVFTAPLLVTLLIGIIFRRFKNSVQWISLVAFGISSTYLIYAVDLHRQSMTHAQKDWKIQHPSYFYTSLRSFPTLFQPYLRHLVVRYQDQICVGAHRVPELSNTHSSIHWQCATQLPNACAARLIQTPIGQRFAWFADHHYRAEVLSPNLVRFHDLRYPIFDHPLQGMWGVEGECSPHSQLRYFRTKIPFSMQTLQNLGSYWRGELRDIK